MRLTEGNAMTKTLALTLIFEAVVFVLAVPGMIQVNDIPLALAFGGGGAAAVLALVAGATIGRRPIGWPLAWLAQIAGMALGLLTPWMYAVGGGFAALFALEFFLGKKMEQPQ